jgi:hypothetical protein
MQKMLERKADFIMSETLGNFFNVKYYNAENFETHRYKSVLEVSDHCFLQAFKLGFL